MSTKKSKKKPFAVVLVTEDAMIGALNRYAQVMIELTEKKAAHEQRITELNAEFDLQVQGLREEVGSLESSLQLFCVNNRTLFTDPKSKEYANATVGFRLSPHAVGKLVNDDTFEAIAERMEQVEWGEQYLTYKPAVLNKEALLKDKAVLREGQLVEVGLRFTQKETFFIDLKAESAEGVRKTTEEVAA